MIPTVEWKNDHVVILDQRVLPGEVRFLDCEIYEDVAEAIRNLSVRGAPAIGVTASLGIALGAKQYPGADLKGFLLHMEQVCHAFASTRPTAVNLFWAVDRMKRILASASPSTIQDMQKRLQEEALAVLDEDIRVNRALGKFGSAIIRDGDHILTHCNAGALATAGYGTALGVVRAAWEQGKQIRVYADETRPVLQGARLTAWELQQDGIPVTLITDNAAGALMKQHKIQCCVVGADRIAANGDVANKIGTYSVAVLAKAHGIPFYVAAPSSTIDMQTPAGEGIPIEERSPSEVTCLYGDRRIAPQGIDVWNPAFDVTPAALIAGIITERGIFAPQDLKEHFS
ncbi:MAG: S-methyl-5-thioribose-1-phosphate isomerase [Nitrospirota bacterium]|nr:S-methyl-5-thioribose-1-phosphate isomerase [Nitrospirota bacterium]MDH4360852.1 S-methyl-5-thioribose-1-phosphate isomerase [Nitrospirota bacterium]MDH5296098.1 S-methyl-5-thioribose-1-phosphate isomerase [Nitrospirota bacterium]